MPGEILPPTLYYNHLLCRFCSSFCVSDHWFGEKKSQSVVWWQIGNALNLESRINYDWMIAYRRPFISVEKFIRKSVPLLKFHIISAEIFMDLQVQDSVALFNVEKSLLSFQECPRPRHLYSFRSHTATQIKVYW